MLSRSLHGQQVVHVRETGQVLTMPRANKKPTPSTIPYPQACPKGEAAGPIGAAPPAMSNEVAYYNFSVRDVEPFQRNPWGIYTSVLPRAPRMHNSHACHLYPEHESAISIISRCSHDGDRLIGHR
jgi:hypothetical protein